MRRRGRTRKSASAARAGCARASGSERPLRGALGCATPRRPHRRRPGRWPERAPREGFKIRIYEERIYSVPKTEKKPVVMGISARLQRHCYPGGIRHCYPGLGRHCYPGTCHWHPGWLPVLSRSTATAIPVAFLENPLAATSAARRTRERLENAGRTSEGRLKAPSNPSKRQGAKRHCYPGAVITGKPKARNARRQHLAGVTSIARGVRCGLRERVLVSASELYRSQ